MSVVYYFGLCHLV